MSVARFAQRLLATVCVASFVEFATAQDQPSVTARGPSAEEYRVYDAVVRELLAGGKITLNTHNPVMLLPIREDTVSDSREKPEWDYFQQRLTGLSDEVVHEYLANPQKSDK